MPDAGHLVAFIAAALVIILVPGPAVLFTIGRAIAHGRRAGIVSVAGVTLSSLVFALIVAAGVGALVMSSPVVSLVIKYAGAAYLIYLGITSIIRRRQHAAIEAGDATGAPLRRIFWQGFTVGMTNPKAIAFFAAVLPQFVDAEATWTAPVQLLLYGAIWCVIGFASDSVWALVAGSARDWFAKTPKRIEALTATGGAIIIVLGVILALIP